MESCFVVEEIPFLHRYHNTSNVETQRIHDKDQFAVRLRIDELPSAKERRVKVVTLSEEGEVKVRILQDLTIKKLVNNLASRPSLGTYTP